MKDNLLKYDELTRDEMTVRNNTSLSPEEKQTLLDVIDNKKREIRGNSETIQILRDRYLT